ncbi:MAG: endonuclease/exonuclease/phosphatase family protein [Verrucomicrobiota bacterium]|nr:endonuclease/exonuclease/phosphatase family protein [Verrucomicrobiota bacterium]
MKNKWVIIISLWLVWAGVWGAEDTFSIATYNVQNWMTTDRIIDGERIKLAPKPESEKRAVLSILSKLAPDLLMVQEMGELQDLKDFQSRLKAVGLDYPETEYISGAAPRSHICFLSKFPIKKRESHTTDTFTIKDENHGVQRGFIDVDVEVRPGYVVKVMGAHLKSKRGESQSENPKLVRRKEALILRGYISDYLKKSPEGRLIVLGDFNDFSDSAAVKSIVGGKGSEHRMFDLWLKDYVRDGWTHYYHSERSYAQLDYIVVSPSLFKAWVREESFIYREKPEDPIHLQWNSASDHRPLFAKFRIQR